LQLAGALFYSLEVTGYNEVREKTDMAKNTSTYSTRLTNKYEINGKEGYIGSYLLAELEKRNFNKEAFFCFRGTSDVVGSFFNSDDDLKINYAGIKQALEQKKKIIFPSSVAVYGECKKAKEEDILNPFSPYAIHKILCENYIKLFAKEYIIFRITSVYGGNMTHGLINALKNGERIRGDGNTIRDYLHISDLIEAIIASIDWPSGIYNIGSGKALSVNQVADKLGVKKKYTKGVKEPKIMTADISKITDMGWKPTKFL